MDREEIVYFLKALAHPSRLQIIENLDKNGCNVNKLAEDLNIPQSTISQHLGILKKINIVSAKKDGYNTCYKVKDKRVYRILKILKE
jgi:ArsR family transcriptional regulator, arsenate/arsenite/antimonite-responsive transcriptional repressor